jgi:predicted nucleic acid-binding protein
MTGLVFVDTNVLLYSHDETEPAKQPRARAWLERLWRERLGRTSMQVLSEYYVNLRRKSAARIAAEEAWAGVARYLSWKPLPVDEALMLHAREVEQRWRLSWWDSMVVAAAQLQDCTLLLTEDLHDGASFGTLKVRSPFTLSVEEPTAVYAVAPRAASRHRPRGRPKRATKSRPAGERRAQRG